MTKLTSQEIKILKLYEEGEESKIIAYKLGIKYHTLNTHCHNINEKLDTNNIRAAIHCARKAGYLSNYDDLNSFTSQNPNLA